MEKEIEMLNNVPIEASSNKNLSTASMEVEILEDPEWTGFKFITKKKGAHGPSKDQCKKY